MASSITRKNVVEFIDNENKNKVNKITPMTPALYKQSYIDFVCSKLKIKQSEVPPSVYSDLNNIKTYYIKAHRRIDLMLSNHAKYFDKIIQPKRAVSPPPATVCI